jgi:FMN-dependent NADH-azoreductase
MTLFRLDASINPATSSSRALADIVEAEWQAANPGGTIVRKNLGTEPLPATAWTGALAASWTAEEARTKEQHAALALAAAQAEELRSADAALLAVPLYNFGIPQHVKAWDHSTDYLRRILGDVWKADLTTVEREFTLVGVNPALDGFKDLAAQFKDAAHTAAAAAGKSLANA